MSSVSLEIATRIAWALPGVIVMIVGIVQAIRRWNRHPAVSALLVASLGIMLGSSLALKVAVPMILASSLNIGLYFGMLGIAMAFVRTVVWAAMIAAVFGWRTTPEGALPAPLQFSIRGLIVLTIAVALLCGLGRALVGLYGESAQLLLQAINDLPLVVCLGIGVWLAAARWRRHPPVSHLATWGFALAIALPIIPQIAWHFAMRSGSYPMLYGPLNLVLALASAASWALAITAALGWRRPDALSRDHSAFLNGYAAEDEGLYDDLPSKESRTSA